MTWPEAGNLKVEIEVCRMVQRVREGRTENQSKEFDNSLRYLFKWV